MTFDALSGRMKTYFAVSIFLMFLHKVECWYTEEWLDSPFFQAVISSSHWVGLSTEQIVGEAIFLTFCLWLFIGLIMGALVMKGGNWGAIALGIWGLTYLLEWHHLVRAALASGYYSGVYTSVFYLVFGVVYWRELAKHVHLKPREVSST